MAKNKAVSAYNTKEENDLLQKINTSQDHAEGGKRPEIEQEWEDEYNIYQGGGKQWNTSKCLRSERGKKRNFNSEQNFILPMALNIHAALTVMSPTPNVSPTEMNDKEAAEVLNDLLPSILYRNKFTEQFSKIVLQGIVHGIIIGYVPYDQHWIGGSGPNRWVGEIRTLHMKKEEFYPDPAILDLEERLQDCSFVNIKQRKKVDWIKDTWEKGEHVIEDTEDIPKGLEDEGLDPQQATLITHFHKGTPAFISKEWKQEFLKKAEEAEAEGLSYKAKDYRDMASGTLKGVHCAYKAGSVLLDYVPYIYEDGLYPFVYRVLMADSRQPYGMGEVRNVMIPQVMYNKADEIEVGAMLGQGLGGGFYNKGALSSPQRQELLDNIAKPHSWIEANDIHGIEYKKAVQVPPSITNYKHDKKNVMDLITGVTAILQGISPGANIPYSTIKELGARSDLRMKARSNVFVSFLTEMFQLIINRIAQFYTEERKYRILGDRQQFAIEKEVFKVLKQIADMPQGTPPDLQLQALVNVLKFIKLNTEKPMTKTFTRDMLVKTWARETVDGKEMLEEFVPEFDIKVKVMDERPSDPNYFIELALSLYGKALGLKALWKTIDEGKLPPIDEIIEEMEQAQQAQAQAQQQAIQAQQQAELQRQEYGVTKQKMQNDSVERQVGMKIAKDMAKNG